jgi:hypothetical protein
MGVDALATAHDLGSYLYSLLSMHEQTPMTEDDSKQFADTLTKSSAIAIGLCSLPLYLVLAYFGQPGRWRAAAICASLIIAVARGFWESRRSAWFWITLSIVVLTHVLLILLVPWNNTNYPGVVLLPLGLLDFGLIYQCFKVARTVSKKA